MLTLQPALITISTRASLKRYHNYTLTLGVAPTPASPDGTTFVDETYTYTLQRVGTDSEKQSVERELVELRARLGMVERWKKRREEIEVELRQVMISNGESLPPPKYIEKEEDRKEAPNEMEESEMTSEVLV